MNAIRYKLKSRTGASITFALLLFLVCAVISSIVIVAASAVGGRASEMARMDQRYYAVTSAAELLRDVLQEQTVVVTGTSVTTKTLDEADHVVGTPNTVNSAFVVALDGGLPGDAILAQAASSLEGWPDYSGLSAATFPKTLNLAADGEMKNGLSVTAIVTLDRGSGTLTFDVSNTDTDKGVYTLRLKFEMDKREVTDVSTVYDEKKPVAGSIDKYTMQVTETATTRWTMRWKLVGMQTVTATLPETGVTGG